MTRTPLLHAMFHRQIEGDDSLLRLAQERFRAADLGPEFYPQSPAALEHAMTFHPEQTSGTSTVHLPRHLDLFDPRSLDEIIAFARRCGPGVRGLIVHDQPVVAGRFGDYVRQVRALDVRLEEGGPGPLVFIEYACGLDVTRFVELFDVVRDCDRVSACIDISHIAIRQCQRSYSLSHPDIDPCRLKPGATELPPHVEEIQATCRMAVPIVLDAIEGVGALGKPLHFHLHDGHPLLHVQRIWGLRPSQLLPADPNPLRSPWRECLADDLRADGVATGRLGGSANTGGDDLSFTLEIHPPEGRRELGEYGHLFRHWQDLTNAERMNYWIDVLLRNHRLLRDIYAIDTEVTGPGSSRN